MNEKEYALPSIFYQSSDYVNNYSHINTNGESSLLCKKLDLYRSMVTVGVVFENIAPDRNGMRLHPIYHSHVSDKKRIVSYNLGMAFAKYYAEKLLDIPSLIHVENLKSLGVIEFNDVDGRGREPDLVGQCSNGHWHVFEAKGMSINSLNSKILSAKEQVQRVATIDGVVPGTLNACATFFDDDRILTYIVDPESKKEKSFRLKKDTFIDASYKSLFLMESALNRRLKLNIEDGFRYYSINVEAKGVNLKIGLEEEVHDLLKQKEFESISQISKSKFKEQSSILRDHDYSLGLDGIVVKYRDY